NGYQMIGDPTEGALVVAAAKAGLWREAAEAEYPRVNEIPFDSARKRMSTIHRTPNGGGYTIFVKGAPEIMLERMTTILLAGEVVPLTDAMRAEILDVNQQMANQALRVLAVGQRGVSELPDEITPDTIERDLTFIGLIAMIDPARPEVKP